MKNLLYCFVFILFLISCEEKKAHVQLTNKVHNVRLENISYGKIRISSYLLPGESSEKIEISEEDDNISFPFEAQIEFYMLKGDKRVYLKTKNSYKIDEDQELLIEINDNTEVINPMDE